MPPGGSGRVAILYPGTREDRRNPRPERSRFAALFTAFARSDVHAEAAVYDDDFAAEVRDQLLQVDAVLVWVNPIQAGRTRAVLDAILRDVAEHGVFVSAHPDVILKLGTKEVLYTTRETGWGCDTHIYRDLSDIRTQLVTRLAGGRARVLKQNRGNGGMGVWKLQLRESGQPGTAIQVRHAARGSREEAITLEEFLVRCEPYFAGGGLMIDQEYQERLAEGMIRCYLTHGKVNGFGHQAVNMLYPSPPGAEAIEPGPRLYYPPSRLEFQPLKRKLESEWIPAVQDLLNIETERLPIIWDCDFLLGPRGIDNEDTYILCEINVSSVAPFPESAIPVIVEATAARMESMGRAR